MSPDKVLLPTLHIKLGLLKQYVKSLDKGGECFKYICQKFLFLRHEKIKTDVFDESQIQQQLNCINQQSPQRGGAVPDLVWVGSKWLLAVMGFKILRTGSLLYQTH